MDRCKYILKRLEKELRSLEYKEPFLSRDGERFIAVFFPMNPKTEKFYPVQINWLIDDENNMILFHAEREESVEADETAILQFCNEWNKTRPHGTAVYDKENNGLYLDYTLPLPERVSDMFLSIQVYHNLAFAAENFFKEAEKFKWIEKETENNINEGDVKNE